jgi:hypothetical protein
VVVATRCRVDGGEWQPYSEPVLVTGEGVHTFEYQSLDEDGTWEDVQSETIKVDTGAPVLQMRLSRSVIWPPNGQWVPVVVNGSAVDSGSGGVKVVFEVKDEYGEVQPVLSAFGETIQLRAGVRRKDGNGRLYCVTATATDEAGWTATVTRQVLVPRFWCQPPRKVEVVKPKPVVRPKPVLKPKPVVKVKETEKSKKPAPPTLKKVEPKKGKDDRKVVVPKQAKKQKARKNGK